MRERRTDTARRLEQTREKIEKIVADTNDPSHKVFGLVALSFADLFSDITDKLNDVADVQAVQADTLHMQTEALQTHEREEDVLLSKIRGAIWAFTLVGGTLGALLVWIALGLVGDVRETSQEVARISKDVAVNTERINKLSEKFK